jgi:hypothetical protein
MPRGGAAAEMLEVRCGKDIKLQLSAPHRDKLHELYCRAASRRVAIDDPAFLRALFCVLLRYESVGGAGHQATLYYLLLILTIPTSRY